MLAAVWATPLSAAPSCGGSPFACTLPVGAQWGLQQGSDYDRFTPANGALGYATNPHVGMSLVSASTLDRTKPMSVEMVVQVDSLDNCASVAYVGPVIYAGGVDDGDPTGRYRAEYISCFPGDPTPRVWLYSPTYAAVMPGSPVVTLGRHTLREDWYPGVRVDYFYDGQMLFTEDSSFGHDPLDEPHDPHPSLWFGSSTGIVFEYTAFN